MRQYAFFWIPADDPGAAQADLNAFLASHRVVHVLGTAQKDWRTLVVAVLVRWF